MQKMEAVISASSNMIHFADHKRRRDSPEDSTTSHRRANNGDVKQTAGKSGGLKTLESHREEMKRLREDEMKV